MKTPWDPQKVQGQVPIQKLGGRERRDEVVEVLSEYPSTKESTSQPSRPKERPRRPKTQKIRNTRDADRHHLAIPKRNTERETFRLNKKEPDSNSGPREERKRNSVGEHVGKYSINVFFCL